MNKIDRIPEKDLFGLTIGEVEQLSLNNNKPGEFILTTHIQENYGVSIRTIKTYFLSFDTELKATLHNYVLNDIEGYRYPVWCDSNATNLYENGSETYPFKSLTRALLFVNYNKLVDAEQILIKHGDYNVGTLYNLHKGNINPGDASPVNFLGITELVNCDLIFGTNDTNNYNFYKISVSGGKVSFNGTTNASNTITINSASVRIGYLPQLLVFDKPKQLRLIV